jgi:hypothetical protein
MKQTAIKLFATSLLFAATSLFSSPLEDLRVAVAYSDNIDGYRYDRFSDRPAYFYNNRHYYGGHYRNGYYYINGHRLKGGTYYQYNRVYANNVRPSIANLLLANIIINQYTYIMDDIIMAVHTKMDIIITKVAD